MPDHASHEVTASDGNDQTSADLGPTATAAKAHHHGAAADAAARRMAARRNVDLSRDNQDHANGPDANRLLVDGKPVHAVRKTGIYTTGGGGGVRLLGHASKDDVVRVNAGSICRLPLPDAKGHVHERTCVLAFDVEGHTGWVDVDDLEHHAEVVALQRTIEKRVDAQRKDGADKFHPPEAVNPRPSPPAFRGLHTFPHQTGDGGLPEHYYERPGGLVNLLVNVPTPGGSRYGVADDVVAAGAEFSRAEGVAEERVPLWTTGKPGKKTAHAITFVYGYVKNAAGEKRYGWINRACLGA